MGGDPLTLQACNPLIQNCTVGNVGTATFGISFEETQDPSPVVLPPLPAGLMVTPPPTSALFRGPAFVHGPAPSFEGASFEDLEAIAQAHFVHRAGQDIAYVQANIRPGHYYTFREDRDLLPQVLLGQLPIIFTGPDTHQSRLVFTVERASNEAGKSVPAIRFTRMSDDEIISANFLRANLTRSEEDDSDNTLLMAGTLLSTGKIGEKMGGPRPIGTPSPSFVSIGIQIGVTTALYAFIDDKVIHSSIPENLKPQAIIGGTLLGYEFLYQTGQVANLGAAWLEGRGIISLGGNQLFPSTPAGTRWRRIGGALPMGYVVGTGAALLYDEMGLPLGTFENDVATFGTVATGYVGGALLAQKYPELAAIYRASTTGAGMEVATVGGRALSLGENIFLASGGPAGGAGVLGGVMQGFGAAGAVGLGNFVGQTAVDIWAYASDTDEDPDYRLMMAAYNYLLHDASGTVLFIFGGAIMKGMQAIASACSDDFDRELWQSIEDTQDKWVRGSEQFGKAVEQDLVQVYASHIRGDGTVNWDSLQRDLYVLFGRYGEETMETQYKNLELTGHRATQAQKIKDLLSVKGSIQSEKKFKESMDGLIPNLLATVKRENENRLIALKLGERDAQGKFHEIKVSHMNAEQAAFYNGSGGVSEAMRWRSSLGTLIGYIKSTRSPVEHVH